MKGKPKMSNTDRWKPALNEDYYYINRLGEIHSLVWYNDFDDRAFYAMGNCFATEKEAEEVANTWKRLLN